MSHGNAKSTTLRKFVEGAQLTMSYETAIGLNAISGHTPFRGVGRRSSLATTAGGDDLWEGVAAEIPYPDQTNGEQLTLVSTDANDTSAGSGAQQVDVHGIRKGGAEYFETVTMNGLTPVNTTVTDWIFVQYIHTSRVTNLGDTTAGDVRVYRTGDATRVYDVIKAGGNVSLGSHRMVPANKTLRLNYIKADAVDNKPISVRFRATCDFEGVLTPNIFIFNEVFELQNSSTAMHLPMPRMFPAGCIIKGTAISTTSGGTASLSYDGWLE